MASSSPEPEPRRVRLLLIGFGAVNRTLVEILLKKQELLRRQAGLRLLVVGVADSRGGCRSEDGGGLDLQRLLDHKVAEKKSVASFPGTLPSQDALALCRDLGEAGYDILVEGSPVNLADGGVGLLCARQALQSGKCAVLANKAPLVLAFEELLLLAGDAPSRLLYSATVCGGLPVLNVGRRDLACAGTEFRCIRGIFNSTTNYMLTEMAAGRSFDDALGKAQELGIAEADPSLDVDGWDAANKLVIIANALLGHRAKLAEVEVQGIRGLSCERVAEAKASGRTYKLVATAEKSPDGYALSVKLDAVPDRDFLARVSGWEMAVEFHTDIFEVVSLKIDETSVVPTSAAVLRDIVHCCEAR